MEALKRDGIVGTLFRDSNQYGPLSMLLVLLISATVTGALIKIVSVLDFSFLWSWIPL